MKKYMILLLASLALHSWHATTIQNQVVLLLKKWQETGG